MALGTVVLDVDALMAQRAASGGDKFDEMWEGTLHVVNAPSTAHAIALSRLLVGLAPYAAARNLLIAEGVAIFGDDPKTSWRIPDLVVFAETQADAAGIKGSAELAVEVLSPGDESFAKVPFYTDRGVVQVLIIDPTTGTVIADFDGRRQRPPGPTAIRCLGVRLVTIDGRLEIRPDQPEAPHPRR